MVLDPAATWGDRDRGRRARDALHVCDARQPRSAGIPSMGCKIAGIVDCATGIGGIRDPDEVED
jgi:hypothetical protein